MMKRIGKRIFSFFTAAVLLAGMAVPALPDATGIIKGTVDTPYVKRYEALVYVDRVEGKTFPPPREKVSMSQKNLVFKPHVLPVVKGTTVDFTNDDTTIHNVFAPPGSAKTFNLGTYGVGVTKTVTFDTLGEVPLLCSVHAEMAGFILVLQNPYFALTDKAGNFEIKGVPPGSYKLKVWNEKLQDASQNVTVVAGKSTSVKFSGLKKR
jgi:plastocyanin